MPNRILKESVCTSENVDQLTAFQETFFFRLIVNCDDYGRMDARPQILSSKLFPLKGIRQNQIIDALRALSSAELVTLYEKDGHPFLQMRTWDRHQTIRAKKSKYPAPDDNCKQMQADDFNCKQMNADESKCSRNPIQSNPNPESNPNPNPTRTREEKSPDDSLFALFWNAYPRKEGKENARKAFSKLNVDGGLMDILLKAIEKQKGSAQWQESGGQFIPYPATWLNGKRWEDEVKPASVVEKKPVKKAPAQQYEQRDYVDEDNAAFQRMIQEWRNG